MTRIAVALHRAAIVCANGFRFKNEFSSRFFFRFSFRYFVQRLLFYDSVVKWKKKRTINDTESRVTEMTIKKQRE